jgi:hypothetical protein
VANAEANAGQSDEQKAEAKARREKEQQEWEEYCRQEQEWEAYETQTKALIAKATERSNRSPNRSFTLAEWLERDMQPPDFLLGNLLSTSSRILLYADTGVGKTMLALAVAMASAHSSGFLHWPGVRPARVLYVDAEMSADLMKERLQDECRRLGAAPENLHILSREDCLAMQPLNTLKGQLFIEKEIMRLGGIDFIIFDNVMTLITGDQKEEEGWRETLPWVLSLSRWKIGQMWVHHTGHDASRAYGTKTREWQMTLVMRLEKKERPDTDVSFLLVFQKARDRKPDNRAQFEDQGCGPTPAAGGTLLHPLQHSKGYPQHATRNSPYRAVLRVLRRLPKLLLRNVAQCCAPVITRD